MENPIGSSKAEKDRLRQQLDRQVQTFLESGGSITVVDDGQQRVPHALRGSTWHSGPGLDIGLSPEN